MSKEAAKCFHEGLESSLEYCRHEFDLTYSEAIGVLELFKFDLLMEAQQSEAAE